MRKYLDFKAYLQTLDSYNFKFNDVLNYLFENKFTIEEYSKKKEENHYIIKFTDNTLVEIFPKNDGLVVKIQYGR